MKFIGIIILSFLFSVLTFAQQGTYLRVFSGSSYDEGVAAFRLPNKEIRLIGNTGSYGHGSTDVWYIALDSMGNFLWHKFYATPEVEKVNAAVMTQNGDIFMVGSTTQNKANSYQLYFLGLDQYGQVIASQNYGGSNWDFGYGICQINDSAFALVGETYSYGNGQSDVYLLKVNRQGDTLWTKTFGGLEVDRGNSVKLMPDSGFIIAGATKNTGNNSLSSTLIRLDENGDSLWIKVISSTSDAELLSVNIDRDTNLICAGYEKDSLNTYRDNSLQKYSRGGDFIWSALSMKEGQDCYSTSIFQDPNGDYTYCGITTKYGASQYSNARISRISNSGWWTASKSIGDIGEDNSKFVSIDNFNGKHYFLVGTTKSYGVNRSGIFFVRLDSNFNYDTSRIINSPTSIAPLANMPLLKVYPNPVNNQLSIDLPPKNENLQMAVYDLRGKLIILQSLKSGIGTQSIDVTTLPDGIYQLILNGTNIKYHARFIKVSP